MRIFFFLLSLWSSSVMASTDTCQGVYQNLTQAQTACAAVGYQYGCVDNTNYSYCVSRGATSALCSKGVDSNWNYQYYCQGICPVGETPDATGKCVAQCQYNNAIASTDPACTPPPACATGAACSGDVYRCTLTPEQYEARVTCDVPQPSSFDDGNACECQPEAVSSCYGYAFDSSVWCTYTGTTTGLSFTGTAGPVSSGTSTTVETSNAIAPSSCPTGYSLNLSGYCESAAVPGTVTTSTTAGTASSPGAASCPVGSSDIGGGWCQLDPVLNVCPSGYTLTADNKCIGQSTLASAGPGATSDNATADETAAATAALAAANSTLQGLADSAVNDYQGSKSAWFSWVWTPPVGTCSPYAGVVHGYAISWDLCPTIDNIRDVLAWLFALAGSWTIYLQMFRKGQ